jgi:hypothetical protein
LSLPLALAEFSRYVLGSAAASFSKLSTSLFMDRGFFVNRFESSNGDSIEIESEVRVAFAVFLTIELLVMAGTLLTFAVPQSAFLQGMLFGFLAIGVWNSTVSAFLFSVVAINHPRIKTFLWTVVLTAIAVTKWIIFALPYASYFAAIQATVFEMIVAISAIPTTWLEYFLVYRIVRLKMHVTKR